MKYFLQTIAVLLVTSPASAQSIAVQTGDHPTFTRIVLTIGEDRDWELTEVDPETWEVELDPEPADFNLGQAFDLIQRNRLLNLAQDGTLQLELACACSVSAFRFDNQYLVIDVSDASIETVDEVIEVAEQEPDERAEERAAAAAALPNLARLLTDDVTEVQPTQPGQPTPNPQAPLDPDGPPSADTMAEDIDSPEEIAAPNPRLEEAARIMAEQLARAAASGLLDIDIEQPFEAGDPLPDPEPLDPEPTADETPQMEDQPLAQDDIDGFPIHAENALDIALNLDQLSFEPVEPGACRNVEFNARSWTEADSFYGGLGPLRLGLYDERDVLIEDAAIALAQHYLFFGFGAEALFWLEQTENAPEGLSGVALLVAGETSAPFPSVNAPTDCSDGELLWRYLGNAVVADLTTDDLNAIDRAFANLPASLRDQMGPRLARQLNEDGLLGTARNIRNIVARGGRIPDARLRALDVDLGIVAEREFEETSALLAEAVRDDGGDPVGLMASVLAFDRRRGELPTPSRLVAADALLREYEGTNTTAVLWQEVLIGRAALGEIDTAINMLEEPGHNQEAWDRAMTTLVAERANVRDVAALLILAHRFGRNWRPEGSVAGRAQVEAISVLREAGYNQAAEILQDSRRPLILPSRDGPETAPEPAQIAWQNRDWETLAIEGSGAHSGIANRLAALSPEQQAPENLAELADQVEDSRDLRALVAELLAEPGLQE